ncbi:hypothetical protein Tco_1459259 [Tanacetum coccineum]
MEDTMLDLLEDCRQKELYCIHNNVDDLIESALNSKLLLINLNSQHFDKEKQEVKNIVEQATKHRTRITSCLQNFKVIHKESTIPLNKTPQISPVNAITHDLPTEEPEYSLSMGDKHLDTISETESDKVIKSSVENLVPIPSESEDFSDNESECDMPVCDDFTTFSNPLFDSNDDFTSSDDKSLSNEDVPKENFKMYSNPLFDDEEIISTKIDPHSFNAESNLIESLLNRDTLIDSSPKFDYLLEEFSGELAHIDPIPPGIEEADFDLEEEIRLVENLSYDNSSPRPPEECNSENVDTIIESPSPSPIPVEDSDSHMEEIDLFLASDDSMPPGIENDDYDSEGDIRFLEELLSNDPLPLPKIESSNLDHYYDPSSPRPPPEPPDVEICFDVEPDTIVKNDFEELNEDECFDPWGSQTTPRIDKGKGIATELDEDPSKRLVSASTIIRPDPDEPVRVEFMINGKIIYLTEQEIQEYWEKEEKIKKAAEEAKLLAMSRLEVIKVVHEEAKKLGIDPKEAISTKAGETFKKAQDAEHEVLKREHSKKVKRLAKLNRRRAEEYMWTMTNRIKPKRITDVRIHPNTKPIVASVFRDNDKRNFDVHQPFKFSDFGITELDELGPII